MRVVARHKIDVFFLKKKQDRNQMGVKETRFVRWGAKKEFRFF